MKNKVYSVAYFVSHAIQYQAPLLKKIAAQPDIDLHVFFLTNPNKQQHIDNGFNQKIEWDVPLYEGYSFSFLDSKMASSDYSLNNPSVKLRSVNHALKSQSWDAVWVHGYNNIALLQVIYHCFKNSVPLLFRGESNLLCSRQTPFKNLFLKWLVKKSTGLLWIGKANREYYQYYGAIDSQLFFTPYAVDNDFFQSFSSNVNNNKRCILLFASKFISRKNAPLLLDAFAQLDIPIRNKAELWFIGNGSQYSDLDQRINELKLSDQVFLKGFKNQSELPVVISQCDVFILPSEKEPFGLIINEVMNLAKPVITTDEVGAAQDLVEHGRNGWVIPANNLAILTKTLAQAINKNEQLNEMGKISLDKINQWSFAEDIEGIRSALNSID